MAKPNGFIQQLTSSDAWREELRKCLIRKQACTGGPHIDSHIRRARRNIEYWGLIESGMTPEQARAAVGQ